MRDKAVLRNLIATATSIAERGYAGQEVNELLDRAEQEIFALSDREVRPAFVRLDGLLNSTFDTIERLFEQKQAVTGVLADEQKKKAALPDVEPPSSYQPWTWSRIEIVDWLTRWGLLISGLCLMAGLFTRFACLSGAFLLLLFYITMPPLPGVPEVAKSEGTYVFVNKNLIEMIALLALATTSSGRWLGLDGLLVALFRRRKPEPDEPMSWRVH